MARPVHGALRRTVEAEEDAGDLAKFTQGIEMALKKYAIQYQFSVRISVDYAHSCGPRSKYVSRMIVKRRVLRGWKSRHRYV